MIEQLLQATADLLAWQTLLFLLGGVLFGLVFGVIPGLGGTTALAILLPLTFGMQITNAFAMAGGIMGAIAMGGSISAILLNAPGTAPSAATCIDGYPLAQQGRAADAIGAVATASPLGGLLGVLTLLLVLPLARDIVLLFGPPEFFLIAVFGIVSVALADSANLLRGLIAGGIGLMLSFVGYDAVHGGVRFAFGSDYLWDGIPLIPALVGLFGMAEMIGFPLGKSRRCNERRAQHLASLAGCDSRFPDRYIDRRDTRRRRYRRHVHCILDDEKGRQASRDVWQRAH